MNKKLLRTGIYAFALLMLGLTSCSKQKWVKLDYSDKNEFVRIQLNDDQLKVPLQMTFSETDGAIYVETSAGKKYLKGKPFHVKITASIFNALWKLDELEINLSIQKKEGAYEFALSSTPTLEIKGWGMNLAATSDEYFTGLFERVVDGNQTESWKKGITTALNLRGEAVEMLIRPTLSLYTPFYLSSNGYGLFFNGTWPGHYDFCKTDPNRVMLSFEGKTMSGIIYTSKQPANIVKAHSLHVGPTIVPPRWAFLPWRWRDNHENRPTYFDGTKVSAPFNSQVVEDVLMMKAFDIPCGVYWVDRPWASGMHGYVDFEWDSQRFPNAVEMIDWLHENDMKFLLWVAPWVTGNMRNEALEKGYSIPIKGAYGGIQPHEVALIDFTNPQACTWLQEKGIEKMLKQGVDGFKLDRSEELITESYEIAYHDGRTSREVRNHYPVLYVKTFNEACRRIKGDDFVLIPRAGYTGSSQYSGFWGGDIGSDPEGLRTAIVALQRCAVIGFPIWGSDIGGYWQGDLDREVTARWLAFGCFNPIMEFGPTEDRAPWDMRKEPHFDSELIAIWRTYAKIHANLADYTHNLAQEAHETGMPIVRPLFLQYPDQAEAWANWQTFLYGPDLLVSAIWEKGVSSHNCYLPAGETWVDAWDLSKEYEGGQTLEVETPLAKIPIFIRKGSSLQLGNLSELYLESSILAQQTPNLSELQRQIAKK